MDKQHNILDTPDTGCQESGEMLTRIIRSRRSIYANDYNGQDIPASQLEEILTNATWAPTHKMTEPWRFLVLQGQQLTLLGRHMAEYYRSYYQERLSEEDAQRKYDYLCTYPTKAACVIGILLQRHAASGLPEWEEIAATSCAVHNMTLTATALGIASYWDSGAGTIDYIRSLGIDPQEQSLGALFLGYTNDHSRPANKRRTSVAAKASWIS